MRLGERQNGSGTHTLLARGTEGTEDPLISCGTQETG